MPEAPEKGIVVDKSRFPIVLVLFGRSYSDDEWAGSLTEVDELSRRGPKFVVLNVTRADMETPTARHRKAIADWNAVYVASGRTTILGWGTVIESHALRGVLTALTWVTKFPYAMTALPSLDKGIEWANQLLKDAGNKQ